MPCCDGSRTHPDRRGATSAAGCPGCGDCLPACEACTGEVLPGVIWPIAVNGDGARDWVQRCDTCARFPSDEEAAQALLDAGHVHAVRSAVPYGMDPAYPAPYVPRMSTRELTKPLGMGGGKREAQRQAQLKRMVAA